MNEAAVAELAEAWRKVSLLYVDESVLAQMRAALETHDLGGAMRALPSLEQAREKARQLVMVLADKLREVYRDTTEAERSRISAMMRAARLDKAAKKPQAKIPQGEALKPTQGRSTENPMSQVPHTERWLLQEAAELVVDITEEQKQNLRRVLAARYDPTLRPDVIVRDVKLVVGLTDRETEWVLSRRDKLEEKGLSPREIENETKRYAAELHQLRGERIARTEAVFVETEAKETAWTQARAEGELPPDISKEWVSSRNACDECLAMDGQVVGVGEMFSTPEGPLKGPPYHPHCECGVELSFAERRKQE